MSALMLVKFRNFEEFRRAIGWLEDILSEDDEGLDEAGRILFDALFAAEELDD